MANELYAVFVGINEYESETMSNLSCAVSDVTEFQELCRKRYPHDEQRFTLLASPAGKGQSLPTRHRLLTTLAKLAHAPMDDDDTFLLYFAGHGYSDEEESFLLTCDTESLTLTDTAVALPTLQKYLRRISAGQQIIILDACRNEFGKSSRGLTESRATPQMTRDIQALAKSAGGEAKSRPVRRAILSSCAEGQVSYEYRRASHSWFCHNLLEYLQEKGTQFIDLVELTEEVGRRMQKNAWLHLPEAAQQTPQLVVEGTRVFFAGWDGDLLPRSKPATRAVESPPEALKPDPAEARVAGLLAQVDAALRVGHVKDAARIWKDAEKASSGFPKAAAAVIVAKAELDAHRAGFVKTLLTEANSMVETGQLGVLRAKVEEARQAAIGDSGSEAAIESFKAAVKTRAMDLLARAESAISSGEAAVFGTAFNTVRGMQDMLRDDQIAARLRFIQQAKEKAATSYRQPPLPRTQPTAPPPVLQVTNARQLALSILYLTLILVIGSRVMGDVIRLRVGAGSAVAVVIIVILAVALRGNIRPLSQGPR